MGQGEERREERVYLLVCEMVITSLQLLAGSPGALFVLAELARLFIFSLAAVIEALLAARLAAFWLSLLESLAQAERAAWASSSYFRHFPKAAVQFFRAAVMAADSLLALQVFSSSMEWLRVLWVQQ